MRPYLEHISSPSDASWVLFDRKLKRIPFEWHYNSEYELTLTLNSEGQRFIGDNISSYKHGDLVLMGPKIPHTWCSSPESHNGQTHQAIVLWFTESFVHTLVEPHIELRPAKELLLRSGRGLTFTDEVRGKAATIMQEMLVQPPGARLAALINLLLLLAGDPKPSPLASPRSEVPNLESSSEERIGRAITYLHENYEQELSIQKLCSVAALSRSSLHRLFKLRVGMTISDYVAQLRIGHACALLMNSQKPIAIIADQVGYNNLAHFNRQFKILKNTTPRGFRNDFNR
jgi:AraC-like DNA-binding protein